jgi:hypothetical protein
VGLERAGEQEALAEQAPEIEERGVEQQVETVPADPERMGAEGQPCEERRRRRRPSAGVGCEDVRPRVPRARPGRAVTKSIGTRTPAAITHPSTASAGGAGRRVVTFWLPRDEAR